MKKLKKDNNERIENLSYNLKKNLKNEAIILSVTQYRKSQEMIMQKIVNENTSLSYGINLINKKVIANIEKYQGIEKELNELLKRYKDNLEELAKSYDSQIVSIYLKIYEEEVKQADMQKEIFYLTQEEKKAKMKLDNSDDEIREKICDLEDEVSKCEQKIRRVKVDLKKKITDKELEIGKAIESKETEIQKETIKGPRIFSKATRFFLGKLNPHKAIEKNVFSNLKKRIELYESEKNIKKANEKYLEENIISTIDELSLTIGG